jgi:hypothetical protein
VIQAWQMVNLKALGDAVWVSFSFLSLVCYSLRR